MLVERKCPRTGFKEQINTEGNYIPKGWKRSSSYGIKYKIDKKTGFKYTI